MLDYGIDRSRELIRLSMKDAKTSALNLESAIVDDAISYFDRSTDHVTVNAAMKSRFATSIEKREIPGSDVAFETYRNALLEEQIDLGLYESITSGTGARIATANASLFTSETQHWEFLYDSGEPSEDAEAIIEAHRHVGAFTTAIIGADWLSCAINGSLILVEWIGGHLKYHLVSPTCFHVLFHQEIYDDGELRGVDYTELEDATAIVLRMSDDLDTAPNQQQYLAIFGRSELYPWGRRVMYRSNKWDEIPDVGMGGTDYTIGDQPANPLSWLAATNRDQVIPEYPIITLDGGFSKIRRQIVQTSTSLYENCIEIDIAMSRLLKDVLNSARGKDVITSQMGEPLPRSLEGIVSLRETQTLEIMGRDASHSQIAMDVLRSIVVSIASGYNVPDYQVVANADSLAQASGVSLLVRTAPLIKFRNFRVKSNGPQIDRLFQIEKNLLAIHKPEDGNKLVGISQTWDPGYYHIPEDKKELVERLGAAQDKGYLDYVMAVKEYHRLRTVSEAMALIDEMNERKTTYPGNAVRKIAPPIGLTRQG